MPNEPKKPSRSRTARLGMKSQVTPDMGYAGKTQGQGLAVDDNGNPTNLTPEVHEAFMQDMLKHGDWPAMTAYRVGVSPFTAEGWIARGASPHAIEPYRSFAASFVACEAVIHGRLLAVIMGEALGAEQPADGAAPKPKGNPAWAAWLLLHRWGTLWRINRDTGRTNGTTVAEVVDQTLAKFSEARRDKAKAIIAQLSQEARASARKEGFLL